MVKVQYTDKKENEIFPIHKEIQMDWLQSHTYMRKGFLKYVPDSLAMKILICGMYKF
jgi:hypothetical protein